MFRYVLTAWRNVARQTTDGNTNNRTVETSHKLGHVHSLMMNTFLYWSA